MSTMTMNIQDVENDGFAISYEEEGILLSPVQVTSVTWISTLSGHLGVRVRVEAYVLAGPHAGETISDSAQAVCPCWGSLSAFPAMREAISEALRLREENDAREFQRQKNQIARQERQQSRRAQILEGPWAAWITTPITPIGDDPPPPEGCRWLRSPSVSRGLARYFKLCTWLEAEDDIPPPWEQAGLASVDACPPSGRS